MPITGKVSMLAVTDKQYGEIETVFGKAAKKEVKAPVQLDFF
jgi:CRISPR/Cas system-associated protein endoribonuclease Cas2